MLDYHYRYHNHEEFVLLFVQEYDVANAQAKLKLLRSLTTKWKSEKLIANVFDLLE